MLKKIWNLSPKIPSNPNELKRLSSRNRISGPCAGNSNHSETFLFLLITILLRRVWLTLYYTNKYFNLNKTLFCHDQSLCYLIHLPFEIQIKITTLIVLTFLTETRYDEDELLESLENNPKLLANDLSARHLRRKLKVRKQLRSRNLPIFDFDQIVRKLATKGSPGQTSINRLCDVKPEQLNPQILDRFQVKLTQKKL